MATLDDIAKKVGVSRATVSRVLHGNVEYARPTFARRAEHIRRVAQEMNYRPNLSARTTRTGRFDAAALIQPLLGPYVASGLLKSLVQVLGEHNVSLSVADIPPAEVSSDFRPPKVMRENAVDGLLINVMTPLPEEFLAAVSSQPGPVIWINERIDHDAVHPDDEALLRLPVEHLVKLGHRRIAYCTPLFEKSRGLHYSYFDRLRGYMNAMSDAGLTAMHLPLPMNQMTLQNVSSDRRIAAAETLLKAADRPTAIIGGAGMAQPVAVAAMRLGLRLPEDLSVFLASHDIDRESGLGLDTAYFSMGELGRAAAEMYLTRVNEPQTSLPTRVIGCRLIAGRTAAAPPA